MEDPYTVLIHHLLTGS